MAAPNLFEQLKDLRTLSHAGEFPKSDGDKAKEVIDNGWASTEQSKQIMDIVNVVIEKHWGTNPDTKLFCEEVLNPRR